MTKLPDAFSPAVLASLAKPAATRHGRLYDSRNAELLSEISPDWYLIEVYPGAERKVADEMVTRRFGIYIPEFEETVVRRGRAIDRVELMFPGYIFAFVWDVIEHRSRIEAIDGVLRVVLDVNGKPLRVTDAEIDLVRKVENQLRPVTLQEFSIEVELPKKKKRRRMKRAVVKVLDEVVSTRAWGWVRSSFDDSVLELDSQERNQTLMRALGLG